MWEKKNAEHRPRATQLQITNIVAVVGSSRTSHGARFQHDLTAVRDTLITAFLVTVVQNQPFLAKTTMLYPIQQKTGMPDEQPFTCPKTSSTKKEGRGRPHPAGVYVTGTNISFYRVSYMEATAKASLRLQTRDSIINVQIRKKKNAS